MHQFQGFGDLRVNGRAQASESTLWPSFTDIMTVILMVFMLTMVVAIVKNAYLAERVRLSREQMLDNEQRLQENLLAMADLRAINTDIEEQLRSKEMEIILLEDEAAALEHAVEARRVIIENLTLENEELLDRIRVIRLGLAERDERLETIETEHARERGRLDTRIAELLAELRANEAAIVTLSSEKTDLEMSLARQRQDFTSLEDEYLRLLRPARSSVGKLVATVRYSRFDGVEAYSLRGVDGAAEVQMERAELHRRLAALKAEHGDELYVKIVIPDDSGLSYNEAWDFTKEILSAYDYYYKDGWPGAGTSAPADQ